MDQNKEKKILENYTCIKNPASFTGIHTFKKNQ